MSRGRGGGSRWRGGHTSVKKEKAGGQEELWDHDRNFLIDKKPREFYPEAYIPRPAPPSRLERAQYMRFQTFRREVRKGPLYSTFDERARAGKTSVKKAANFNPFEDVQTYTQKYKAPLRALPRFDKQRYNSVLFPKELWDVIKPKQKRPSEDIRRKATRISKSNLKASVAREPPKSEAEDDDQKRKRGEDEDEEIREAEDDAVASENPEDDFEDNDSDMAGDYNAEGYFETGEDDVDGLDGDGGEDGGFD